MLRYWLLGNSLGDKRGQEVDAVNQTNRHHLSVHGDTLFINREQGGRVNG